jgi:hypothetical protein
MTASPRLVGAHPRLNPSAGRDRNITDRIIITTPIRDVVLECDQEQLRGLGWGIHWGMTRVRDGQRWTEYRDMTAATLGDRVDLYEGLEYRPVGFEKYWSGARTRSPAAR